MSVKDYCKNRFVCEQTYEDNLLSLLSFCILRESIL